MLAVAVLLMGDEPPPALAGGDLSSQEANKVLPLTQFLASVRAARYEQYISRTGATVSSKEAFAEMQAYILQRYNGIDIGRVKYHVVDAGGSDLRLSASGRLSKSTRDTPQSTRECDVTLSLSASKAYDILSTDDISISTYSPGDFGEICTSAEFLSKVNSASHSTN
jgi:hypothetical protein